MQSAALRGCRAREVRMGGVTRWSWELAGGREGENGVVGITEAFLPAGGRVHGARHEHTQEKYGMIMRGM